MKKLPAWLPGRSPRVVSLLFVTVAGLGLQSCLPSKSSPSAVAPQKLVLTGSSTVAPLASELAKAYEAEHPEVRIDVQAGGSSRGIADAQAGVADIGMVSRALKSTEQDLQGFTVAKDGIAVIVNAANPVTVLSDQQIMDLYTKKISRWQQVGGLDAPVTVVNKAEGRSTLELFASYFQLQPAQIKADVVIGDNQQGIKTVAGNPNAIGYVSIGAAEFEVEQGAAIKLLPVSGVEPTTATVQDETFPISRPLNFVTTGPPTGVQKAFIEFAQSPAANRIVKELYFVPLAE